MIRRASLLALPIVLVACNQDPGADNGQGLDAPAPLPVSTSTATGPAYPLPPYAMTKGATIPDFSFTGFIDPHTESAAMQPIALSDFYNPHADDPTYQPGAVDDRLFPKGSLYGPPGTKKPRALVIDIASVWCGPCNEEAKSVLNGLYARYKPCGGEFLFQLAEGAAAGAPATPQLLKTWTSLYKVAYPSIIDDSKQLFSFYSADSFPDAAIIDTRTMKIIDVVAGVADQTFWSTFEAHLDQTCLAKQ